MRLAIQSFPIGSSYHLEAGDRLVIGGGMVRDVVEVRLKNLSGKLEGTRVVILRDPYNQRVEKIFLDQLLHHMHQGWVVKES